MTETKVNTCLGCGRPLPPDHLGPNPQRMYHGETCRDLHRRSLEAFRGRAPELPGWGCSPAARLGSKDRLRVTRGADGRLAVRFEKGPAKRSVKEHHGTDPLPIFYYLDARATEEDAAAFLRQSYPEAEVVL